MSENGEAEAGAAARGAEPYESQRTDVVSAHDEAAQERTIAGAKKHPGISASVGTRESLDDAS
jgi:hypothetical protein